MGQGGPEDAILSYHGLMGGPLRLRSPKGRKLDITPSREVFGQGLIYGPPSGRPTAGPTNSAMAKPHRPPCSAGKGRNLQPPTLRDNPIF
jgi:hypothetical protein